MDLQQLDQERFERVTREDKRIAHKILTLLRKEKVSVFSNRVIKINKHCPDIYFIYSVLAENGYKSHIGYNNSKMLVIDDMASGMIYEEYLSGKYQIIFDY